MFYHNGLIILKVTWPIAEECCVGFLKQIQ